MTNAPVPLRLLLVDADPDFVRIFQTRVGSLPDHAVTVRVCSSCRDMLDRCFAEPFDLIFLDLGLPEKDPLDVIPRLIQTSLPLPLVVLSKENDVRPAVKAMRLGVLDHLMKDDFLTMDLAGYVDRVRETFRLRRENAELLQISQMKNDFLATISHELRTPLTSILGLSEILLTGRIGGLSDRQKEMLQKITEQSQNLSKIINQLLEVQDIVQERLKLNRAPLSLGALAEAGISSVRKAYGDKGVGLFVQGTDAALPLYGDRDVLAKVLEHVLQNALKFTPTGGTVRVTAASAAGGVELTVADTGKGVPPQALPYVFQKFFHVDQSLTRPHGGLGLGLAYCKHIVEAHGGRIWLESAGADRGTTVHLSFPRWAPDPKKSDTQTKTVLWVDDNPTMLELMEVGFSSFTEPVRLVTCSNGNEALEMVRASPPDLVVLDIMMPGMNGLEVLDRLKVEKKFSSIPVLVVTGYREAAEESLTHGAADFFLKPFRVTEMVEKVRHYLQFAP